jgi:hypothetical protein
LPCVFPSWVYESVREGYAVTIEPHLLAHKEVVKCSTPNPGETREYNTDNSYAYNKFENDWLFRTVPYFSGFEFNFTGILPAILDLTPHARSVALCTQFVT